jgi:hypothetical protein
MEQEDILMVRSAPAQPGRVSNHAQRRCKTILAQPLRRLFVFVVVGLAAFLGGCGENGIMARLMLKPDHIVIEQRPDAAYEKFFPYYVELCAASQFRSKLTGPAGVAGHAVMYLKGACKDDDAPFPLLRRCRHVATTLDDPEHGAGISVNAQFKSINWVAVPGYDLFFAGNLAPGERLTRAKFDALEQEVITRGVYKGVTFQPYPGASSEPDLKDFLEKDGIGTDVALQFARSVFCARLPVTEGMLDQMIAFLNDKNREYAEGEANYNWDVWADNCAHTVRNALAAANIWSPLSVRAIKFRQIFNLAVPANEFVNLAELMTQGNIDDYRWILRDGPRRDAFHEFHWLPTEPGALLKTLPVHSPNDLYDTTFRLFTLQSPFLMGKTQTAIDLLSTERFVDLDANLHYFEKRYDAILAQHDERRDTMASVRGTPFRRVERLYYDYIRTQRDAVHSMLSQIAAMAANSNQRAGE